MTHSDQINELAAALCKAQAVMKGAPRDSDNPHFRSRFASLASVWEACREALTSNGLSVIQMPGMAPEGAVDLVSEGEIVDAGRSVAVTTMLLHASGQWIRETLTMTARDSSPQSVGSAITYARRYGLQAAVGICPEDDDGHEASHEAQRPQPQRSRAQAPQRQANGHDQPRPYDGPPRSGKALFAALKALEEKVDLPIIKYINTWAKNYDWPARMIDFDTDMVALAWEEAMRKVRTVRSGDEIEAATGREPGEEG